MSFQVGIGSLGECVFSGGTLYPSVNYYKVPNLMVLCSTICDVWSGVNFDFTKLYKVY